MSELPALDEARPGGGLLRARRIWYRPDFLVIAVSGEIDMETAPVLEVALDGVVPESTVVDLAKVTFLAAAGLRVLVTAAERARANGCRFGLVAEDHVALRVLRMSGVAAAIPTYPSLSDAIRSLPLPELRAVPVTPPL